MYNKYNQHYEVLGRFRVSDVEYVRVKFTNTKHEQIVTASILKSGEFSDTSIIVKPNRKSIVEQINESPELPMSSTKIDVDKHTFIGEGNIITTDSLEVSGANEITAEVVDLEEFIEAQPTKIIAINPKGEEIEVADLESFCIDNKLDLDVVNSVLDGLQKTHRKWRFKQV